MGCAMPQITRPQIARGSPHFIPCPATVPATMPERYRQESGVTRRTSPTIPVFIECARVFVEFPDFRTGDVTCQSMPRLTAVELQEARVRSGRLGGRPRRVSVTEARDAALAELVPPAITVLRQHLERGGADAWKPALRILEHSIGRPPDAPALPVIPDTAEGWEKLTDAQLVVLAGAGAD